MNSSRQVGCGDSWGVWDEQTRVLFTCSFSQDRYMYGYTSDAQQLRRSKARNGQRSNKRQFHPIPLKFNPRRLHRMIRGVCAIGFRDSGHDSCHACIENNLKRIARRIFRKTLPRFQRDFCPVLHASLRSRCVSASGVEGSYPSTSLSDSNGREG